MKKIQNQGQFSIGYRVDLDPNSKWYNQSKSGVLALTSFEFASRKSPLVARQKAFKFVNVKDRPVKPRDLNVFLVDLTTGKDYLIFNGGLSSVEVLANLELERKLYEDRGFAFEGWMLQAYQQRNIGRKSDQPCCSLTPAF